MTNPSLDSRLPVRGPRWKWWICGLLLLATMINYVDRLTVNLMSSEIKSAFDLNSRDYGLLEEAFGNAFAIGAIVMGFLADRVNVRLLYPLAVVAWSLAGFATGLAQGFATLILCRFLLGMAESGNWPCALRTTQRLLTREERTLGNSILQSGAAFGAILTPLIVGWLFKATGSWRYPFMVVGVLGMFWAFFWLASIRKEELETPRGTAPSLLGILGVLVVLLSLDLLVYLVYAPRPGQSATSLSATWVPLGVKFLTTSIGIFFVYRWLEWATRTEVAGAAGDRTEGRPARPTLPRWLFLRRFWVLAIITATINLTWHFFRAWLPLFLREQHGFDLDELLSFSILYYLATDCGSLLIGFAALGLTCWGLAVHTSRALLFGVCSLLTCLSLAAAVLPTGDLLLVVLLLIGFASLGLFPLYYALSQELTVEHQGKLTGSLGCICWMTMALMHKLAGELVMLTGSYSRGIALAGLAPLAGLAALVLFWGKTPELPAAEAEGPLPVVKLEPALAGNEGIRSMVSEVRE